MTSMFFSLFISYIDAIVKDFLKICWSHDCDKTLLSFPFYRLLVGHRLLVLVQRRHGKVQLQAYVVVLPLL